MLQVRLGFLSRSNCELVCHATASKPLDLRKYEPHPVALFVALQQFSADFLENRILSIDKPLQVMRIAYIRSPHRSETRDDERNDPGGPLHHCPYPIGTHHIRLETLELAERSEGSAIDFSPVPSAA